MLVARSEAFAYLPDACHLAALLQKFAIFARLQGIFDPSRDSNFNGLSCGQVQAGIAFTDDCPSRQREFGEACCNTDPIVCDIAQSGELIPGAVAFVHECVIQVNPVSSMSIPRGMFLAGGTPVSQTCRVAARSQQGNYELNF